MVAHVPNGCHPSPCPDYYGRDHAFFDAYHESSRTRDGFLEWLESWLVRKDTL